MEKVEGYIALTPNGHIITPSFHYRRRVCQHRFFMSWIPGNAKRDWKIYYRKGYRIKRAVIATLPKLVNIK